MTKKFAFAAVAAFGLAAGVAFADTAVTAKLAAPTQEAGRVIAGGAVWNCAGDTCTARLERKPSVRVCMELAREVGQVTALTQLTDEDVARCNARAGITVATTAVAQN